MSHFIHAPGPAACRRPPSEPVVVVPGARVCPRVPRLPVTSVDGRLPDRTGNVALADVARIVPDAVAGNLASLTEGGNPADSGISSDAVRQAVAEAGTAYQKPEDGVPKTDLSEGVQASLGLADAAVQPDDILSGGTIKSSLLPSYVDDVVEYASLSAFPHPGEGGKIYVALDTNIQYRWSGTQYIEIAKVIVPSTSAPLVDGAASAGSSEAYSRGDHRHPTDTTRASVAAATLAERGPNKDGFSAWTVTPSTYDDGTYVYDLRIEWFDNGWSVASDDPVTPGLIATFSAPKGTAADTTISWVEGVDAFENFTATRTALPGYQLGSQTTKPLASEAEAEALRTCVASLFLKLAPEWASGTTYKQYNLVQYNGALYYKKSSGESSSTDTPSGSSTDWQSFASLSDLTQLFLPLTGGTVTGALEAKRNFTIGTSEIVGGVKLEPTIIGGQISLFNGTSITTLALSESVPDRHLYVGMPSRDGTLAVLPNLADYYNDSYTYALDSLCIVGSRLYRCTTAITTAEDWTAAHWTEATVEDVLAALRTGKQDALSQTQLDNIAAVPNKANASDLEPLLFAQYYPDGSVKSTAEFTAGIKYDAPDTTNRTITVKPFFNTGDSANDNSNLRGRVVIPPFVDASGNGYISDDGTRFKVVGVSDWDGPGDPSTNLTAIVVPNTVTTIGNWAFNNCTSLTSVSLPAATTIGDNAFAICTSLTSVSLPAAESIGSGAFIYCDTLTSVDFGDTPRSSVPSLGLIVFSDIPSTCKIIVPYTQYDAWKAADGWKDLQQEFVRHAEKADKPATFTVGNLAALDANGNPTDSGVKASDKLDSTSAAPAFSTSSTYAVGEHVTYNGGLYRCTTAVTTAGAWTGSANWTADTMTDPDAVLDISAQNQLRVVAKDGTILWAQGYDLASTSSATLACDAVNSFTFADGATSQAFALPTAPIGKVGDFGLDIDNSANTSAATITLTGLDTTFSVVVPKGESLNDMLAIAAGELARFYVTLTTFRVNSLPTWHIIKQVVENGGATV